MGGGGEVALGVYRFGPSRPYMWWCYNFTTLWTQSRSNSCCNTVVNSTVLSVCHVTALNSMFTAWTWTSLNPLTPHCCHMGTDIKHPVPDRAKSSFVIFDIRALWRSGLSVRVPGCQKLQMLAYPSLEQDALLLYPYMATAGVKGLMSQWSVVSCVTIAVQC